MLAVATAAIAAGGTAASAAVDGGPIVPAATSATKTIDVVYSCDMSAYGGTSPVDMTAVISGPTAVTLGDSADISFSTETITLPPSVITGFQNVTDVSFSAVAAVDDGGSTQNATLKSFTAPAILLHPTSIPSTLPLGASVTLPAAGTAVVNQPATVVITPTDASGKSLTPIQCSADTSAASQSISITVNAPVITPPSGPVYTCSFSVNGKTLGSASGPLPMSLSASGTRTTGSTDSITLSSPGTGLGGPYQGATAVAFHGSLPVTGAQQGSVSLSRRTTDVSSTTFKVTGHLTLTKPGTDRVHLPQTFTFTLYGPSGSQPVVLSCKSKASPSPVALTLKVTGQPTVEASVTPVATPSPATSGTPVGAPATGGGRPASSLPLVAGGAALLAFGGLGLALAARRRRA